MGSTVKTATYSGKDVHEAWRNLQEELNEEYGHQQGYSGELNSCTLEKRLSDAAFENLDEDDIPKRVAYYRVLREPKESTNKIKTVVELFPNKGSRVWETRYCVYSTSGSLISSKKLQADAIKDARTYTEKTKERCYVDIEKVLLKQSTTVAKISYKKASSEREGVYEFIGCCPC